MGCWQENILSSYLGKKYRERKEKAEGLPRHDSAAMRETGSAPGSHSHLCFSVFDQRTSESEYSEQPLMFWLCRQQGQRQY